MIEQSTNHASENGASGPTTVGYGILTAVFLLGFLLLTSALNGHPRFIPSSTSRLQPGWTAFTDAAQQFTFNLPERWQQLDGTTAVANDRLQTVLATNGRYRQALHIFDQIDADNEIVFVARHPTAENVFLLVAENPRLRDLPIDRFVTAVRAQEPNLLQVDTVPQIRSGEQVILSFNMSAEQQEWRCLEMFVPADTTGYVMAGCTPATRFSLHDEELSGALASFQILSN